MLTLSKREQNALQNKEALLNAAIYIVQNYGASKLTIQNLCDVSNISNGSFYNLFKTKEDLIAYYMRHAFGQAISFEEESEDLNPSERILRIYSEYAACCKKTGYEFVGLFYSTTNQSLDLARRSPEESFVLDAVARIISEGCESGFFKNDLDVDEITFRIAVISTGIAFYWCVSQGFFDLRERLDSFLSDYLETLRS